MSVEDDDGGDGYDEESGYEDEESLDRDDDDRSEFADPGGTSSLYAATRRNPRVYPCPTCGRENQLTLRDVAEHYQCDGCASRAEGGGF